MRKIIAVLSGLFLCVYAAGAQNLIDDLKSIASGLDSARSVEISVVCKVYSKKDGELVSTANTGIIKKGKLTVSVFDELEIFSNNQYGVYVNHENKSIAVLSKNKYAERFKSVDEKGINQFVTWLKQQQTKKSFAPVLIAEEGDVRTYAIRNGDKNLKEVLVSLNTKQKTILKISYEFSQESEQKQKYILLSYSKFRLNDSEIELNQSDYFIQQSGKFLPGNKYKTYSVTTDL